MRIHLHSAPKGIALIMVMIVIASLGILAGGFAYSMKIETKLAQNSSFEADLEWLGRSGVEFARYVLAQSLMVPAEPWDSLNQKWAGGPMGTNDVLAEISLEGNELGMGAFSIQIFDLERKFNINTITDANTFILERALEMLGVDRAEFPTIIESYLDWRDLDDNTRLSGAETAEYLSNPNPGFPPHVAKNGQIDHLSELLLIRGITPEMYWGGYQDGVPSPSPLRHGPRQIGIESSFFDGGLVDLFTPISVGRINLNTAPAHVLQMIPGMDESLAQGIISIRAGMDGIDGTEDDTPFATPGELINVPGMTREIIGAIQPYFITRSYTFEVHVEAQIDDYKRTFVALLRRANQRQIQVLSFSRK